MARPRVRPDLTKLATLPFADEFVLAKYGTAARTLRDVLRLADDVAQVVAAFSEREPAMMRGESAGRRPPRLGKLDLPVRLPRDPTVRSALAPLVVAFVDLRDRVVRHDHDEPLDPPAALPRRLTTRALHIAAALMATACDAAGVDRPTEYELVALAVSANPKQQTRAAKQVKSRLDRWRYALQNTERTRAALSVYRGRSRPAVMFPPNSG